MNISKQLKFFINLSIVHSKISKSFDTGLGNGLGFNDFLILYILYMSPEKKMRRIDLANKISLTASGITRLLLPMEKIGLVSREESETDGRVSYVKISTSGKRLLEEALDRAELKSKELLPTTTTKNINDLSEIFSLFNLNELVD